jgi:hypothetical protein
MIELKSLSLWVGVSSANGTCLRERSRICQALAGMYWSVCVSYEHGIPGAVRSHDCGFDRSSLCLLAYQQTTNFTYARPEDHSDPVPADERFLRACGVRPPDMRDGHFTPRRGEAL